MDFNIQEDLLWDRPIQPPQSFFNSRLHPFLTQQTSLLRSVAVSIAQTVSKKTDDRKEQVTISPGAANVHAWFDGVEAITRTLWPPALLAMLGYDVYHYVQNPSRLYQMTLQNLLLGLPENYDYKNSALSINLGGDIASIHRLEYWPWSILLAGALASGFLFQFLSSRELSLQWDDFSDKPNRNFLVKIREDAIGSFPYLSPAYWRLYGSRQILLKQDYRIEEQNFDVRQTHREIKSDYVTLACGASPQAKRILNRTTDPELSPETVDQLENILQNSSYLSYFAKTSAIAQLAQVAHWRRQDKLGARALLELKKAGNNSFYARYKLWSIGVLKSTLFSLLGYLIIAPVQWYARLRLWALLVTKIMLLEDFLQSQQECLQETKGVWSYTAAIGNYACLPCELDFAAYRPNMTGQDCVDGLLSQPRKPAQIIESLFGVQGHGPFDNIDLHRQNWTNWDRNDWQTLLALLNSSDFSQAPVFNLSQDVAGALAVEPDFLSDLADYLHTSGVQHLDLSGQMISAQGMLALTPGFRNNSRLISVEMARSRLDDSIFNTFISLTPGMASLSSLNLATNQLTGFTMKTLNNLWETNLSLTDLDLSNNLLTTADIDPWQINSSALQRLDISGANLAGGTLNYFCAALTNSSMISLTMNYCRLSPSLAASLFACVALSNISRLDWEGNDMGYSGAQNIAKLLPDSHIEELNLGNNDLDDDAVAQLAAPLTVPNTTLRILELSGNPFTGVGFHSLVSALNISLLQSLSVSQVNLGDDSVDALMITPAEQLPLTRLDLSNTGLSNSGAAQLLLYLANSSLVDLDLSQNFLLGDLSAPLLAIFNSSVLRLNLRQTYVRVEDLQSAFQTLNVSSLQQFDISENDLGDRLAFTLAEQLLSDVPNQQQYLETMTGDIDFSRALTRSSLRTRVRKIDWENDNRLTELGATSLCRVWPFAENSNFNLTLSGVNLNPALSGVAGCPYSHFETSSAGHSAGVPSGILTATMLLMALQSHFSLSPLRVFNACIGAALASGFGVSGVVLGATLGYRAGNIFSGIWKTTHKKSEFKAPNGEYCRSGQSRF